MNAITKMDSIRPAHGELVPSRYALQVGDIDVLVVSDGVISPPSVTMATNADPVVWAPSYKITEWRKSSEQVLWWEAEENTTGDLNGLAGWNDGSSYPQENMLSRRHGRGASVACFDGHVEWMDRVDFLTELQRPGENRLFCAPRLPGGGH